MLQRLKDDESLLVQSGKPVGVFQTHVDAPRVLIANSNLVPHWATWEHFHELDRKGLMMYGQMTAGSWIYIGSQGIVQGTYETFGACARTHFGGDAARPLDPDGGPRRHGRRAAARGDDGGLLDARGRVRRVAHRLSPAHRLRRPQGDDARRGARDRSTRRAARSARSRSACSATRPTSIPELARRKVVPDAVTDQTSAHDPRNGYLPRGWTLAQAAEARQE